MCELGIEPSGVRGYTRLGTKSALLLSTYLPFSHTKYLFTALETET